MFIAMNRFKGTQANEAAFHEFLKSLLVPNLRSLYHWMYPQG